MKLRFLLGVFVVFGFFYSSYAQNGNQNVQVLIKGKITDEFTGKPISVTMEFRQQDGKKFKIKSNSIDGSYQQVMNANQTVDIVFTNFDIVRKSDKLNIKDAAKYEEIIQDFKVQQLVPGRMIMAPDAFEPQQSSLNGNFRSALGNLDEIMKFNRAVKFDIVVSAHDSYAKTITKQAVKPAKKGKKNQPEQVKTSVIEPDANAVRSLVDKRVEAVRALIASSFAYKDRITVSPDYSVNELDSGQSASSFPDMNIVVKELKNMLE